jgi:hypothetical protein
MSDQTAIDVYERGNYSEDHREHRDGDAPKGSPIEHDATLTESVGRADPAALLGGGPTSLTRVKGAAGKSPSPLEVVPIRHVAVGEKLGM